MPASDVSIVIGAKNQASKILGKVQKDARELGSTMQKTSTRGVSANNRLANSFKSLKAAAGPLIAAYAAIKAATAGFRFVGESLSAFEEQDEAVRGLAQALELAGNAAGPSIQQHEAFASSLQSIANVGDEATLALMKQASMLGVENSQLQDVTKAAIGLSEALGISQTEALKKVMVATSGNAAALGEFIPQVRNLETEEQKLAAILDIAGKGLEQKARKADTAAGSMERARNSMGDFKEQIGKALAPIQQLIGTGLAVLAETLTAVVVPALQSVMPSAETMGNVVKSMTTKIVSAITFAEVVLTNFPKVWQIAVASAELQILRLIGGVKHALTVVIPEYARWFGRNWKELIKDAFSNALVIITTYVNTMGKTIMSLWDWVANGFEGGVAGLQQTARKVGEEARESLINGWQTTTEPLPNIIAREITDAEKNALKRMQTLGDDLAEEYNKKFQARISAIKMKAKQNIEINIKSTKDKDKKDKEKDKDAADKTAEAAKLQAKESRLLTRGTADALSVAIQQRDELEKIRQLFAEWGRKPDKDSDALKVEVVGP